MTIKYFDFFIYIDVRGKLEMIEMDYFFIFSFAFPLVIFLFHLGILIFLRDSDKKINNEIISFLFISIDIIWNISQFSFLILKNYCAFGNGISEIFCFLIILGELFIEISALIDINL